MKKRFLSVLAATAVIASCSSLCVSAATPGNYDPEKFSEYIRLEDDWSAIFYGRYEAVYMNPSNGHGATFYFVQRSPDKITFSVSKEVDENVLEQVIKAVDSHLILSYWKHTTTDYYNCTITLKNDEDQYDAIGSNTAKKLYNALSEYSKSFDYSYDQYEYNYGVYEYLTGYEAMEYSFPLEEKLNDYLEQNNINAKLVKYADREINLLGQESIGDTFYIVPNDDISIIEHYELAKSIAKETGIRPHGVMPTGLGGNAKGKSVDFADYLDGDANCDKQMDLADAIFIMQALANPNKYGIDGTAEHHLTEQGKFNGDIDGDGITVGDALTIQFKLLGLE